MSKMLIFKLFNQIWPLTSCFDEVIMPQGTGLEENPNALLIKLYFKPHTMVLCGFNEAYQMEALIFK